MITCSVSIKDQVSVLLTEIEEALGVCLYRGNSHESPVGPTIHYLFFHGETRWGTLKLVGFIDHYEPEVLEFQLTGSAKHNQLFYSVINKWPGTILQHNI